MYVRGVEWLNYHHLYYFWVVAREGSIARARAELRLAQPTISGQLRLLEEALGEKLFERAGRGLVLTEVGRAVYRYADEIFSLGKELVDTVKGRPTGRPARLVVGIDDVMPKLVVRRLLEPALHLEQPVHLVCREETTERLLVELAAHTIDVVLSDAPLGAGTSVRVYGHLLGECAVSFFAERRLAASYQKNFPASLDGAPMLLPTEGTALRRSLDQWFAAHGIRPKIAAEFDDSALLNAFGHDGLGIFPAPSVLEGTFQQQYGARLLGRVDDLKERFYAFSTERRIKHPAVAAICQAARNEIFG
jgi:LysR family transcriptional activator of nhaA